MPWMRRIAHVVLIASGLGVGLAGSPWSSNALAQESNGPDEIDIETLLEGAFKLIGTLTEKSQDGLVKLFEQLELLNIEGEIDRLVESPWGLNDSTTYKLELLPYNMRFPIYTQLTAQMTRQDNLRAQRIHRVSPDQVDVIALRLDLLSQNLDPLAQGAISAQLRDTLLRHFNARELIDLGFFALAQQVFFPETDEGWASLKENIADAMPGIALGAVATGALVNAGAFGQSGKLIKLGNDSRIGWYGGFRKLGFDWHPRVRGGLTLATPGLQLAGGLAERINPESVEPRRTIELAAREGWLDLLSQPQGWDAFFEAALHRVIAHEFEYEGEKTTGRLGFFFKRDYIPLMPNVNLRGSLEVESDLVIETRYATGLGLQHQPSGLTTVLQVSRTRPVSDIPIDTRGGLFLTGTMESPIQHHIDAMRGLARNLRETWDAVVDVEAAIEAYKRRMHVVATSGLGDQERAELAGAMERATADREQLSAKLAQTLANYMESRRLTYTLLRLEKPDDGLHGPLSPEILANAASHVIARLVEVSDQLDEVPATVARLRARKALVGAALHMMKTTTSQALATSSNRADLEWELLAIERALRRQSFLARSGLEAYSYYRATVDRFTRAWGGPTPPLSPTALEHDVMHELVALQIRVPPIGTGN